MAQGNNTNFMVDGYLGGVNSVARAVDISNTNSQSKLPQDKNKDSSQEYNAWTDSRRPKNSTMSNEISIEIPKNVHNSKRTSIDNECNGLTIIPWEEFVKNPRRLNDLFYLETNGIITYDPDDVNVFFHATRMNRPTFGDISENGRAWILTVEKREELAYLQKWLTGRFSVFGVTLVKKGKRFTASQRAPCLVTMNPKRGSIGEMIKTAITRSMACMKENKKFCIEINLNNCVERWCQDVLAIDCRVVGARLIITNGEEKEESFDGLEDIVCCVACFPVWALQTGIYKLHRRSTYTDQVLDLVNQPLCLHGAAGSVDNQRRKLFRDYDRGEIFRTKPDEHAINQMADNVIDADAYKYICVKKYERKQGDETKTKLVEYQTTNLQNLVSKKIVEEDFKITLEQNGAKDNEASNFDETYNITDDAKFSAFIQQEVVVEHHTDEYKTNVKSSKADIKTESHSQIELDVLSAGKGSSVQDESTEIHSFREESDAGTEEDQRRKVKRANWDLDNGQINGDVTVNTPPLDTTGQGPRNGQKVSRSNLNGSSFKFRQMPVVKEEDNEVNKNAVRKSKNTMEPDDSNESSDEAEVKDSSAVTGRYDVAAMFEKRHKKSDKTMSNGGEKVNYAYDHDDFSRTAKGTPKTVNSVENENDSKNARFIPVSKTDDTNLVDTRDFNDESKIVNDTDMMCCDVEDLDGEENETGSHQKNVNLQTNERRRGRPQYDSRRKYLGVPMQKKIPAPAKNASYADVNL